MPRVIFVNLPVAGLANARAFYEAIGAASQPKFGHAWRPLWMQAEPDVQVREAFAKARLR